MMFRYIALLLLTVLAFQNCNGGSAVQSQSPPAGGTGIQVTNTDSSPSESTSPSPIASSPSPITTSTPTTPITKGDPPADNPDRNNGGVGPQFTVDIAVLSNENSDGTIFYTGQVFLPGTNITCPILPNPITIYFNGHDYGFTIAIIDRASGKFSFLTNNRNSTILSNVDGRVLGFITNPAVGVSIPMGFD